MVFLFFSPTIDLVGAPGLGYAAVLAQGYLLFFFVHVLVRRILQRSEAVDCITCKLGRRCMRPYRRGDGGVVMNPCVYPPTVLPPRDLVYV